MSTIIIMNNLFHLLQTSDSFFPSGSYAHSNGLEGLIQRGVVHDQNSLTEFIEASVLPTLQHVDLPYLRFAFTAAKAQDIVRLKALDATYHAMKGSREMREASSKIGSQRLRMLEQIKSHALFTELASEDFFAHAVIVCGVESAVIGIPVREMMTAYYYQTLLSLFSASLKLLKIGHTAVQILLRSYLDKGTMIIEQSEKITEETAGWFSPLWDIASARHETAYSRLFIS